MADKYNKSTLERVFRYIKESVFLLIVSLLLSGISVALTLYIPIIVGDVIDIISADVGIDFAIIGKLFAKMTVFIGIATLCQWLVGVINNRITYKIVCKIRQDAFDKIQTLPVSYMDSHGHGKIVSRIISDVDTFSDGLLMGFTQLFTSILTILGTLVLMVRINFIIALCVVVLTPASMLVSKFIASKTFRLFREQAAAREEQTHLTEEVISNQKTVKAFSMEDEMTEKFEKANAKFTGIATNAIFFSSLVNPSTRFVNGIVYAAVALIGALVSIGGSITVGALTCLLGYANQYTKPFNEISGVITEFQNAVACVSRVFDLLDAPSESENIDNVKLPSAIRGDVEISGVYFSYTPDKPLIEDFNIDIKAGSKVAIVGPTGCGKTTLINLLMRFYDVQRGTIRLDGVDVNEISRQTLRKNYGMVLQDTWIKRGSVAENIAMGKPDATREEIIDAAKAVMAHSFIKRLPDGYDTVLSEDGGELSAGQKQLISIARVMLAVPPVLILDEATSSIDTRTEAKIQVAFDKLTEGRTSFIVAHRLTTILNADVIIVMRDGHIVEMGTHLELMKKDSFYKELYESRILKSDAG